MPGYRTKKNYKQWLSITLILLCCASPLAPALGIPGRPVIATADDGKDDDDDDQRRFRNFSSCSGGQSFEGTMFAVTVGNKLLNFNPGTPGEINRSRPITGLAQGENVVSIDFRPANGQLYALTTASRLYTINPSNGVATPVGAPFTPALNGQSFGIDFNPVSDRLRVVSDAGQDLRLNPNTGAIAAMDPMLAFASGDPNAGKAPRVVGAAYTNNFAGSTSTTLYEIDSNLGALVRQGSVGGAPVSPNSGQLSTVGSLGVNTSNMVGFDIAPVTNAAFASLTPPGAAASNLYTINLATGAATLIGPIGGKQLIRDIAYAVRAENVFAVTAGNKLIRFNPGVPGVINSSRVISGLGSGEKIVGIDFRPATGQLYALSDASRLYTINTKNAVATPVGGPFTPALNGQSFGFDFNPTVDKIRVVSDAGQDLRLNPNNGVVAAVDAMLAFAAGDPNAGKTPRVVGAAYTNGFLGASSTTLYEIDSNLNALITQGSAAGVTPAVSPNTGQLFTVGPLGVGVGTNGVGFDISSESGAAFASFNTPGGAATQLYTINLTTGAATLIGPIGGSDMIRAIAIEVRLPEVFAVTTDNVLVSFNAATPGVINSGRAIRGLSRREKIVGIDFRPATRQLYALSSAGHLYLILIDSDSSRAIAVRLNRFLNPALNGTNFGFDFNPVSDRIRVVSDAGQDLRLNPNDGTVAATDPMLAFAAGDPNAANKPRIVGAGYTNSFLGASTTTLYEIDSNLNALVRQGSVGGAPVSPNTGQLFTVGPLGVTVGGGPVGFDIASPSNAGFASLTPQGATRSQFYTVNLVTGAATLIGPIGGLNEPVQGVAVGGFSRVRGFDFCIQDDRDGSTLQFDSCTGDFQVTKCGRGGFLFTGKGETNRSGNLLTLRAEKVFALVNISPTARSRSGMAVVKSGRVFTMKDSDMTNNTCDCR